MSQTLGMNRKIQRRAAQQGGILEYVPEDFAQHQEPVLCSPIDIVVAVFQQSALWACRFIDSRPDSII